MIAGPRAGILVHARHAHAKPQPQHHQRTRPHPCIEHARDATLPSVGIRPGLIAGQPIFAHLDDLERRRVTRGRGRGPSQHVHPLAATPPTESPPDSHAGSGGRQRSSEIRPPAIPIPKDRSCSHRFALELLRPRKPRPACAAVRSQYGWTGRRPRNVSQRNPHRGNIRAVTHRGRHWPFRRAVAQARCDGARRWCRSGGTVHARSWRWLVGLVGGEARSPGLEFDGGDVDDVGQQSVPAGGDDELQLLVIGKARRERGPRRL